MKKQSNLWALLVISALLSSCSAVAGIFKAGAAVGVIAVIVVILVIVWILSMFRRRS